GDGAPDPGLPGRPVVSRIPKGRVAAGRATGILARLTSGARPPWRGPVPAAQRVPGPGNRDRRERPTTGGDNDMSETSGSATAPSVPAAAAAAAAAPAEPPPWLVATCHYTTRDVKQYVHVVQRTTHKRSWPIYVVVFVLSLVGGVTIGVINAIG